MLPVMYVMLVVYVGYLALCAYHIIRDWKD